MARTSTVAVFGGSFDPPHVGHLLAAAYVLAVEPVDELLMVPVYRHPFDKRLAPFADRLAMCRLAVAGLAAVQVSDIEGRLGGRSRTLHTIEALLAARPDRALRLVIGADVLAEQDKWYRFDRIAELAPPIVLGRAGVEHPGAPPALLPPVQSSRIRAALAAGRAAEVQRLVPRAVADYIEAHGLYQRVAP